MNTYVIADNYGNHLSFIVVCSENGTSPVYLIPNRAESIGGNPYIVYGDRVEEWTGVSRYAQRIIVAHVRSGRLVPEVEEGKQS